MGKSLQPRSQTAGDSSPSAWERGQAVAGCTGHVMDKPDAPNDESSLELTDMAEYEAQGAPDGAPQEKGAETEAEEKRPGSGDSKVELDDGKEELLDGKEKKAKREQWDNRVQFMLTLIGYAVGLGNVWRFSYLCAKNGGSTFLLPYLIMLFVLGIPLFYLELSLGQSLALGPIGAWLHVTPNLGGVGIAAIVVIVYFCMYYNVIIGWVIFYFVNSFQAILPWAQCYGNDVTTYPGPNRTEEIFENFTGDVYALERCINASTQFYWYVTALGASGSIEAAESFNWRMLLCLFGAWVLIYICLFRGIESSGKIIYFTATFPYVVLTCLFFRAVTLPGAGIGLSYLFLPQDTWRTKLFDPQVWLEAATQIFFSLGVATGALIALASYSKPRYNTLVDSVIVCLVNSFTSIFAAITIFSVVGFKAERSNTSPELVAQGPGLAFVIFGEAVINMPVAPLWAVLFFIMLLLLGLDSQFATLEGLITVLRDNKHIRKIRKEILVGVICIVMFVVSIPFVLGNGVYLFQLFDQYVSTIPLLLIGLFEFIAIAWVYGVKRFFTEITNPYHRYLRYLWTVLWGVVNPIVMLVIFIGSIVAQVTDPLQYDAYQNFTEVKVDYPPWSQFLGSTITLSSILCIPGFLIIRLIFYKSAREEAIDFFRDILSKLQRAWRWLRNLMLRRSWRRRSDSEEDVPYAKMSNGMTYGTETSTTTKSSSL